MKRLYAMVILLMTCIFYALAWPITPAQASDTNRLVVRIQPIARLQEAGAAVTLKMSVRCPRGYQPLEAFAYINQDEQESQWGAIPLTCDGKTHHVQVVVRAFDSVRYHRGEAHATAYILLIDEAGQTTISGGDAGTIRILGEK